MTEENPGFRVTIKDVFAEVKLLSTILNEYMQRQSPAVAVLQERQHSLEMELHKLQLDFESSHESGRQDRRARTSIRWALVAAVSGSLISVILAFVLHH